MTQAVREALTEALERPNPTAPAKLERLREISQGAASLPVLDDRTAEEILGFND